MVVAPKTLSHFNLGNEDKSYSLRAAFIIINTVFMVIIGTVYFFASPFILSLLNKPGFFLAAPIFFILLAGYIAELSIGYTNYSLIVNDIRFPRVMNSIIMGTVNIGFGILLIPHYGLLGAAITFSATKVLFSVSNLILSLVLVKNNIVISNLQVIKTRLLSLKSV